ncbi:MAG: hypothetical protein RB296_10650 [Acidobacteriota bacterium]|jgi:hypothetical protein|nr:hypothetical protein [Acidobacteriota bacterium]
MKHAVTLLLLVVTVTIPAQESNHFCRRSAQPWRYYRVNTVTEYSGTVLALHQRKCYAHQSMVVLEIRTPAGESVLVETAPPGFLDPLPALNDRITVTGSRVPVPDPPPLIIARRITWKKRTIELRDPHGFPLWHQQERKRERRGRRASSL